MRSTVHVAWNVFTRDHIVEAPDPRKEIRYAGILQRSKLLRILQGQNCVRKAKGARRERS